MIGSSIRLGKIAGIEIGVNYSLLLIAALVTYQLYAFELPQRAPGFSESSYLVYGVFGALLFFASILWHELAHSLMARFYKIRVRRIVLFFLGGVAEIEQEPRKAHQEFWIAILGPISSVVLGGLFLGAGSLIGGATVMAEVFFWLGLINILLAIFNMIPGFPLDGGRVLRAAIWWISGSYLRATRWASYIGQGFAYFLILSGIVSLFVNTLLIGSALWLLILGVFLLNAAKGHLQSAHVRVGLSGISLGELVRNRMPVDASWPLPYAIDMMAVGSGGVASAAPVVRNGQLVGVLALETLQVLPRLQWGGTRVENVMVPIDRVRAVEAQRDLYEALQDEDLRQQPYLLITDDRRPIGFLSQRDIMNFAERRLRST